MDSTRLIFVPAGFAGALIVVLLVRRLWGDFQRMRVLAAEVDHEMAVIRNLSTDEAFARAQAVLRESTKRPWTSAMAPESERFLSELDDRVAAFLRQHHSVTLSESETILSAESLRKPQRSIGWRTIGVDENRPEWWLCIEPSGDTVAEMIDGKVRETYKSLWHYIVIMEEE
jgi:hypothetical protein